MKKDVFRTRRFLPEAMPDRWGVLKQANAVCSSYILTSCFIFMSVNQIEIDNTEFKSKYLMVSM